MLSVLIASEIRLHRDGLAELLARHASLSVVGTAMQADEALQKACELNPSVIVLDSSLPYGLALSRSLSQIRPDIRVVALGVPDTEESLLGCAEAGVVGYVPREGSVQDLIEAIQLAARGELNCTPQLAGAIIRRLAWRAASGGDLRGSPLTRRESEIVTLIDQGLSNKEIAVRLGIEIATVKNHVHNLLEKLQVRRRAEAPARLRGREPWRPSLRSASRRAE